jgi:chromosome segregation ATPase
VGAIQKKEEQLQKRLLEIEEKLANYELEMRSYKSEHNKLKKEMRFFESMLLEEYHLLLQLLEKDKTGIRLHHLP